MTSLARIAVLGLSCTALSVGAEQTAHPRVVLVRLQDDADSHNELVFETEYLLAANSAALKPGEKGRWGSWWDLEGFWDVDPVRFPNGLEPVVAAAREKGKKLSVSVADRLDFIWVKIK